MHQLDISALLQLGMVRFGLVQLFEGFGEPRNGVLVLSKMARFWFSSGPNYEPDLLLFAGILAMSESDWNCFTCNSNISPVISHSVLTHFNWFLNHLSHLRCTALQLCQMTAISTTWIRGPQIAVSIWTDWKSGMHSVLHKMMAGQVMKALKH